MNCKKCGNKIKENQKFCTQCGNKLQTQEVQKIIENACSACGAEYYEGEFFCGECGTRIPPVKNNNTSAQKTVKCHSCKQQTRAKQNFCTKCGYAIHARLIF